MLINRLCAHYRERLDTERNGFRPVSGVTLQNCGLPMSESNAPTRPIISVAISPRSSADLPDLQHALSEIAQQDSTIRISAIDGQTIVSGMGESHLESVCARISDEYKIEVEVGDPQITYLETIRKQAEAEGKYIRQAGGSGQYGHVKIRLEPNKPGKGFEFEDTTKGGEIPKGYIKPIELGITEAMEGGSLVGYPMVDIRATLYDGSYHELDSNELAFKTAASMAFKEAVRKASPVLLEPVMSVEVVVAEEYMGAVIGDLNSRRGRFEGIEHRAGSQVIKSMVPLAEMLAYAVDLHFVAQGCATFSMHFSRYEEAPYRGESGGEEAGVTANKPKGPKPRRGFAAAKLDTKFE